MHPKACLAPLVFFLRPAGCALALSVAALTGLSTARAQLTWGVNGAGGAGNWDATTANWYNGTSNVPWDGNAAVFAGTPGTVSAAVFLPVQAMTFNVAGYTISNGYFLAPANLTVTTNADATIASTATSNTFGGTFIKNGTGTLTYSGTNFFGNVQLNAGEYAAATTSGSFFSSFTLANAPGVVLTLAGAISGLNGGGTAGGVVRPVVQNGTVTVTNFGGGSFAGVVQDNGSTALAFEQFSSATTQALTGANTYSGATTVGAGTLTLAGNGSTLNTASVSVGGGTSLVLDNSGAASSNRLSANVPVSVTAGRVSLLGNAATAVTQQLGALQYAGAATLSATQTGSATARLSFASAARQGSATLNVASPSGVTWGGVANGANGIIANYVTSGNEWAVVGADGTVQALANYATNAATAGTADHVKLTAASTTLSASTTWNTLNLQNADTSAHALDLGAGHTLTLAGAGVLSSGSGTNTITGGTLAAGGELVVTNRNALTINSVLAETATGTAFTKGGAGTLTVSGANTYTGATNLTEGTLAVSSDANLGRGTTINFNGGTLQANASFTTAKNLATGTPQVGSIDTNGYNVTVTGTNAAVQQSGAGLLTLTNAATGFTYTSPSGGTLVLPNAGSGYSTLMGGTLRVAGTLDQLALEQSSTLDVGGSGAQTLTLKNFQSLGAGNTILTIRFSLGSTAQDRLAIQSGAPPFFGNGSVLFTIDGLGTVQTGVSYTLLNLPNGSNGYMPAEFGLSPESTAAGYRGTFTVGANTVSVNFSAVPEPGVGALLAAGCAGLLALGRLARGRTTAGF